MPKANRVGGDKTADKPPTAIVLRFVGGPPYKGPPTPTKSGSPTADKLGAGYM